MSTASTHARSASPGEAASPRVVGVFAATPEAALRMAPPRQHDVHRVVLGAQTVPGCTPLDHYLGADFEQRLISAFGAASRTWHHRAGGLRIFVVDGVDVAALGEFSFLTRVVLEKGRTLVAVSDALEALHPTEVVCDAVLAPYLRALYAGPLQVHGEERPQRLSGPALAREALLGIGYKLVFAPLMARWLQWRKGRPLATNAPLFLGSEHGLKNLEPFLERICRDSRREIHVLRPVAQLTRNRGLASTTLPWCVTYMEQLLTPLGAMRSAWRTLRAAAWFRRAARRSAFDGLFPWHGRDCLALFAPEFARFVAAHAPAAFAAHAMAGPLLAARPTRVFFDNANAWAFSVLVEHCRRAGIPTTGFVNGMVQDTIPFRSAAATMLTAGTWDRDLLAPLMPWSQVVAYGCVPPENPLPPETRRNLLIISSSCRDLENRRAFARVVAEYIARHVPAGAYEEIVLKLHPYEDPEAMRGYLAEFPEALARIRITRTGLAAELARAKLAVCLLSTVLRELAADGTPFLLFDSIEWPRHTFYREVPSSLKFTSAGELAARLAEPELVNMSVRMLRERYYGAPPPDAMQVLTRHLLGEESACAS